MMLFEMQVYETLNRLRWKLHTYTAEHSVTLTLLAGVTAAAIAVTVTRFFGLFV